MLTLGHKRGRVRLRRLARPRTLLAAAALGVGLMTPAVVFAGQAPSISTTPNPKSGTVGVAIGDTATVIGLPGAKGTVSFALYGPGDPTCDGTNLVNSSLDFESRPLVDGTASTGGSGFVTTAPGTYNWVATYTDGNVEISSKCGDESVVIGAEEPLSITTTPNPKSGIVGVAIGDTATVTGAAPTGTVSFALYGPGDPTCDGTNLVNSSLDFESRPIVDGTASTGGSGFVTTAPGTYNWVATYTDGNREISSKCGDESVVIKAVPAISTKLSATSVTVGDTVTDVATVSGGSHPTGTVSFSVYGPSDSSCTGTDLVAQNSTFKNIPLDTNGTATAPGFKLPDVGTYNWIASYSGDALNSAAATKCGEEQVTSGQVSACTDNQPGCGEVLAETGDSRLIFAGLGALLLILGLGLMAVARRRRPAA